MYAGSVLVCRGHGGAVDTRVCSGNDFSRRNKTSMAADNRGEDREGISQELAELLEYMENGKLYETSSEKLRELHQKIERIKKDKETGVRYMQAWEELEMMREEGIKEGEARGLKAGVSIMLRLCADLGIEKSQILGYIKNTDALPDGAKSQMEEVLGKARE